MGSNLTTTIKIIYFLNKNASASYELGQMAHFKIVFYYFGHK